MLVTDDVSLASEWAQTLGSKGGLHVGWDPFDSGFKFLGMADTDQVLGRTYVNLLLDLRGSFNANDLGKVIPAVKGGGIIILLTPKFEEWALACTSYHKKLTVPPRTLKDCRHLFIPRIIRKLYEYEGISIHRNGRWEKESDELSIHKKLSKSHAPFTPPDDKVLGLARTSEQLELIQTIRDLKPLQTLVLTADRGRGKSAALGLAIAAIRARGQKLNVILTAPRRSQVDTCFDFLERGLKRLNIPYSFKNPQMLLGKRIKVQYMAPDAAVDRQVDLLVVDEAAGIPLPLLKQLANSQVPKIFSTTVHGYEGAGRTFGNLFTKYLKNFIPFTIREPVRYSPGDPIESWLYDALLLNSEPGEASGISGLKSEFPDMKTLFSDEVSLRATIGLMVAAHYQNTPNDLFTLADAPHHSLHLIRNDLKQIVGVNQFCEEGGVNMSQVEGMPGEGNVVPDLVTKHYGDPGFFGLKGRRVVRLVAHPDFQGKGVGSFAIRELEKASPDYDWVGTVFGASGPLVRFWAGNGFVPVTISPRRNEVSGEFSVAMVKPLTSKARELTLAANKQFFSKFIIGLGDVYKAMDPGTARELLRGQSITIKVNMDEMEQARLNLFTEGHHFYEMDADIVHGLAWFYFLSGETYLTENQEKVLVAKAFQKFTWDEVKRLVLCPDPADPYELIRQAVASISNRLK